MWVAVEKGVRCERERSKNVRHHLRLGSAAQAAKTEEHLSKATTSFGHLTYGRAEKHEAQRKSSKMPFLKRIVLRSTQDLGGCRRGDESTSAMLLELEPRTQRAWFPYSCR